MQIVNTNEEEQDIRIAPTQSVDDPAEAQSTDPYPTTKTKFGSEKRDRLLKLAEKQRSPTFLDRMKQRQ